MAKKSMAKSLLDLGLELPEPIIPEVIKPLYDPSAPPVTHAVPTGKTYYFDNDKVEQLLYLYHEGECTDVKLRDEIMSHASELIRQIIRAHNLQAIYPGREESSFGDLFQVAWLQIESVLYKYEALPYCKMCHNPMRPYNSLLADEFLRFDVLLKKVKKCRRCGSKLTRDTVYYKGKSKVFNMWSQVARTVILAYIKRETRDKKNYGGYHQHVTKTGKPRSYIIEKLLQEFEELCKYNDGYIKIIQSIRELYKKDDRPHEGLIAKLVNESGMSRPQIAEFFKFIRLRSYEFTDSPANERPDPFQALREKPEEEDK